MANRVEPFPRPGAQQQGGPNRLSRLLGKRERSAIRLLISYVILSAGALFMLFPVFWMVTAALKPEWQIFIRPPIWIPQHWHKVDAGDTVRNLNLWYANDPDTGKRGEYIQLGTRRFTAVASAASLSDIQSVSRNLLGEAKQTRVGVAEVNVRRYQGKDVIALGTDGDNLLIVELDKIGDIRVLPLDEINAGSRETILIDDYEFRVRRVEIDGETLDLLTIGPNIQWKTMASADAARQAVLVFREELGSADFLPLDRTETDQYVLTSDGDRRYILIEEGGWQPTIAIDILEDHAFAVSRSELALEDEPVLYNKGVFPVGTYTGPDGQTQDIAIVRDVLYGQEDDTVLVLPLEYMDRVQMVPNTSLQRPFSQLVDGLPVLYKDFSLAFVKDETINKKLLPDRVAIIGESQDMALLIPSDAVESAFNTLSDKVKRKTSIAFQWKNFEDALTRDIAGADFIDFFRNSFLVAGLGIVGHLFSCTVVAYAFARMRAPGRDALFLLVLSTMMLPEFVTFVPVYEIFRDLGMVDTLWPLFLRDFFGNAFLIFLLRQFFTSIPMELEEAARIDGANRVQVFLRIMIPLIMPAIATVAIFTFMWHWNDLIHAAIYLNSPKNYTVAIALKAFVGAYEAEFNLLMAASAVVMLPTVLLFFFLQRFFIEGITLTGMKG